MSNLGCFVADDAQKKLLELGQGQCLSWMLTVAESNWSSVFNFIDGTSTGNGHCVC